MLGLDWHTFSHGRPQWFLLRILNLGFGTITTDPSFISRDDRWHFLKSWTLKQHDCTTPGKLTNSIAFDSQNMWNKLHTRLPHDQIGCWNALNGTIRTNKPCPEISLIVACLIKSFHLLFSTFSWIFDVEKHPKQSFTVVSQPLQNHLQTIFIVTLVSS